MIEVLTPEHHANFRWKLAEMYRLRHRVFRERLGWNVRSRDGLECDEFDEKGPTYILAWSPDGMLVGTWRLLPTTGDYMLATVFAAVLEGTPAPRDDGIWETSRFAVDGAACIGLGPHGINKVTSELFSGLVEFCLAHGIREVLQVYDARIARLLPRIGCSPFWESKRHRIDETIAVAGRFTTDFDALERIRRAGEIAGTVLTTGHPPSLVRAA